MPLARLSAEARRNAGLVDVEASDAQRAVVEVERQQTIAAAHVKTHAGVDRDRSHSSQRSTGTVTSASDCRNQSGSLLNEQWSVERCARLPSRLR